MQPIPKFSFLHLLGVAVLLCVGVLLVFRGAKARKVVHATFPEVFRWNALQRTGRGSLAALLAGCLVILPYALDSTVVGNSFDLSVALAATAVSCVGVLDAINRRVAMSDTCVAGVTWAGSVKQAAWQDVTGVTLYDFYGGFFTVRAVGTSIFVPVQIDRPLAALALVERNTPPAALESARRGIAICRAVLDP